MAVVRGTLESEPPYGRGDGPIYVDDAMCLGNESRLADCRRSDTEDCTHFEDAGVRCEYNGDTRVGIQS